MFNGYRCESGIDLWHTGRRYLKEIKICFSSYWISKFWKASDKKMEIVKVKKKIPQFLHRRLSSEFANFSFSVVHTSKILCK